MGIGDWGLGIGQSPIPNPQSPLLSNKINKSIKKNYNNYNNQINNISKI